VSLDPDGTPMIATHGWTRNSSHSLWECLDDFTDGGIEHILCTDISRDGAMTGPNVDLYCEIVQRYPCIRLQASGGVRNIDDLKELATHGITAAITGRALLDGAISPDEVVAFQQSV
jgi:phosphoribosylformimino-5-aminoimidazole carboxamide ribotide isomerase